MKTKYSLSRWMLAGFLVVGCVLVSGCVCINTGQGAIRTAGAMGSRACGGCQKDDSCSGNASCSGDTSRGTSKAWGSETSACAQGTGAPSGPCAAMASLSANTGTGTACREMMAKMMDGSGESCPATGEAGEE